jgi:hypothetical protein
MEKQKLFTESLLRVEFGSSRQNRWSGNCFEKQARNAPASLREIQEAASTIRFEGCGRSKREAGNLQSFYWGGRDMQ